MRVKTKSSPSKRETHYIGDSSGLLLRQQVIAKKLYVSKEISFGEAKVELSLMKIPKRFLETGFHRFQLRVRDMELYQKVGMLELKLRLKPSNHLPQKLIAMFCCRLAEPGGPVKLIGSDESDNDFKKPQNKRSE